MTITIKGVNQSGPAFKSANQDAQSFRKNLGDVNNSLKAIGANVGFQNVKAGASGVAKTFGEIAKAANEDEAATVQLTRAVDNTGQSYKSLSPELNKHIKQAQQMGFDDTTASKALALLTAQTGSGAEAMKRFSLAQDLARGANIDLQTASRLLGKVTDENVSVLQRYGISIEKGATQTELFAKIQERFGGQAKAFADSNAGAAERTKVAYEELQEQMGYKLQPVLTAAYKGFLALPTPIQYGGVALQKFGPEVAQTTVGLLAMGPALASAAKGVGALNLSLAGTAAAMAPVVAVVAAATAGYIAYGQATKLVSDYERDHQKASAGETVTLGILKGALVAANVSTLGFYQALTGLNGKAKEHAKAEADSAAATDDQANAFKNAERNAGGYGQKISDVAEKAKSFNQALNDASSALAGFGNVKTPELLKTEAQIADIDKSIADLQVRLDEAKRNGNKVTVPVEGSMNAIRQANLDVAESYRDLQKAQEAFVKDRSQDNFLAYSRATLDYDNALKSLTKTQQESTTVVNVDVEALQKEIDAKQEARDVAAHHRDALQAETAQTIALGNARIGSAAAAAGEAKSQADLQVAARDAADSIILGFQQAKATLDAVPASTQAIIDNVQGVPPEIAKIGQAAINQKSGFDAMASYFHADSAAVISDAQRTEEAIQRLGAFVAAHPTGNLLSDLTKAAIGHNAGGTASWPGGLTWVGEQGPELINLPGGTRIYNNPDSQRIASTAGAGASPLHVEFNGPFTVQNVNNELDAGRTIANLAFSAYLNFRARGGRA